MQSCLGIYIDNSMIKYAKVLKNGEDIKIESSGVRFFDDIKEALNQIIQETNSYKIPISINLTDESYNYVNVFSVLSKNDIEKTIEVEFENLCRENNIDSSNYECKHLLCENLTEPDMKTAINVSVPKDELESLTEHFDYYKLENVLPTPIVISNLIRINKNTNAIIVNIEYSTTVTVILNGEVKSVYQISDGMGKILSSIGESENSLSKAYEVLKNMTISSQDTGMIDENEYLDVVMPVIDRIINKVSEIRSRIDDDIDNLYVTGTGISINNIDLYFQNFFEEIRCDMLRPEFLENKSLMLPVKEYMEVNSAIALALEGINMQYYDVNFRPDYADVKKRLKQKKASAGVEKKTIFDSKEKLLIRILITLLIFAVGYGIISKNIGKSIDKASDNLDKEIASIESSETDLGKDIDAVESLTETYKDRYNKLTGSEDAINSESSVSNDALPNFMQQVMFSIPSDVTVVSIENVSDIKMSITIKSANKDNMTKFKELLSKEEILTDVTVDSEYTEGNANYETITGDLPR